jgi:hypothetical protein
VTRSTMATWATWRRSKLYILQQPDLPHRSHVANSLPRVWAHARGNLQVATYKFFCSVLVSFICKISISSFFIPLVTKGTLNDPLFDLNFAILLVTGKTLVIDTHSLFPSIYMGNI